jgi:predicted PurR-regulated permease PerM
MDPIKIRNVLFFSALGLISLLFFYVIKPFFFPIFWAAVIAGIFHPLYRRINKRLRSPGTATTLVMLVILVILILPSLVLGSLLFAESLELYNSLNKGATTYQQQVQHMARQAFSHPYLQKLPLDAATVTGALTDGAKGVANFIFQSLRGLTQNTLIFFVQFGIMFYTLFYFIRDGGLFLKMASRLLPLDEERKSGLFETFASTAWATLKVTFIIGGLQGFIGGLLFFFMGIKGALTWGVIMFFLSIVPGVGCSLVWAPAGVILIFMGYVWKGIVILSVGTLLISMVDNFLRPVLLGQDVQMHPLLIFLSTLGGIVLFGISGFVLGPVVTSLLIAFWKIYDETYCEKLS